MRHQHNFLLDEDLIEPKDNFKQWFVKYFEYQKRTNNASLSSIEQNKRSNLQDATEVRSILLCYAAQVFFDQQECSKDNVWNCQ